MGKGGKLFRGVTAAKLDTKARLVIPGKYRLILGENSVFMTVDPSRCLLLYPKQEWLDIEAKLMAMPSLDMRVRSLQRLLLGHAEEIEIDAHNRLLIPALLRDFAGLEHDVVLVGQGKEIEAGILATQMSGSGLPTHLSELSL